MSQQPKIGNKAKEYLALLKSKTTKELLDIREQLKSLFKAERSKPSPNSAVLQGHNIQLSLIGRELKSRTPVDERDKSEAVQNSTIEEVHSQSFEEKLKEKSLDELNEMLVNGKKKLDQLSAMKSEPNVTQERLGEIENRISHFGEKYSAIETEISTRSKGDSGSAKADLNKAQGNILGIEREYLIAGAAAGIVVGAIGHSFGKNFWAFSVLGVGIGGGLVWLSKNAGLQKTAGVKTT